MTNALLTVAAGIAVITLLFFLTRPTPYTLVDLVEADTPEVRQAFVAEATRLAKEAGGGLMLANKVLPPIVIPDENALAADRSTDLLVITWYPTREAGELAFAARKEWANQFVNRTYATQPINPYALKMTGAVLFTLGVFNHAAVPASEDEQKIDSLISTASIVQGAGIYEGKWTEQLRLSDNQPIWMLNFLEYAEKASYGDDVKQSATESISGAEAYDKYFNEMATSLAAVGGRVAFASTALEPLPGTDDGQWHDISIATYPSMQALITMYAQPAYRDAHVHRIAGLARTRLVATQPIAEE